MAIKERGTILNFGNGDIINRLDKEVAKVMDNINNISLDSKKKRKIVITLEFEATNDRKEITCSSNFVTTLVNPDKAKVTLFNYEKIDSVGQKVSLLQEKTNAPVGQIDIFGQINLPVEVAYKVVPTNAKPESISTPIYEGESNIVYEDKDVYPIKLEEIDGNNSNKVVI